MNAALDLLTEARRHGVVISAVGDKLKLKAPFAPPSDLLDRLKEMKADVLAALSQPTGGVVVPYSELVRLYEERAKRGAAAYAQWLRTAEQGEGAP